MSLPNIIPFVHQCLHEVIHSGDTVLDATAGNGYDTCFLAQAVGELGKVWAFDIQQTALKNTEQKLQAANVSCRVALVLDGHQNMDLYITSPIAAAIFNLGYLPKGDKNICTQKNNTLIAIEKSLSLLQVGGRVGIVVYSAHAGGAHERDGILNFVQTLPQRQFDVLYYQFANRPKDAPFALIIEKK